MIQTMMQSYLLILVVISIGALMILVMACCWMFKRERKVEVNRDENKNKENEIPVASKKIFNVEVESIAGEDVMATQLDLARAYLETGKNEIARSLLQVVIEHGNPQQKQEANDLLA